MALPEKCCLLCSGPLGASDTNTRRETAESGALVYDPQRLRCRENVQIVRERLENSDLLRLTEPRSGGCIKMRLAAWPGENAS